MNNYESQPPNLSDFSSLGRSVAMKELSLQTPDENENQCNFILTATVDDTVMDLTSAYDVYAIITYDDVDSGDNPFGSLNTMVTAMQNNRLLLKLTNKNNVWTFTAEVIRNAHISATLVVVAKDVITSSYYVTDMLVANPAPLHSINLTHSVLYLSDNLQGQTSVEVKYYSKLMYFF